jgi:hypothetical protein
MQRCEVIGFTSKRWLITPSGTVHIALIDAVEVEATAQRGQTLLRRVVVENPPQCQCIVCSSNADVRHRPRSSCLQHHSRLSSNQLVFSSYAQIREIWNLVLQCLIWTPSVCKKHFADDKHLMSCTVGQPSISSSLCSIPLQSSTVLIRA